MSSQPDFSRAPPVLYFYGLAGAGKNYVGDLVGRLTGRHVYHADVDLTPDMRKAIAEKRPFTPEMRDEYYAIVADRILSLLKDHKALVVTQGTYKAQHRRYLAARVPGMDLICITADKATILQRLKARGDAVTPEYAAALAANFEPPGAAEKVIANNGGESNILTQLAHLYPATV
jgi:gluconate kinase